VLGSSPKAMNLGTGRCLLRFKPDLLKMEELLTTPTSHCWEPYSKIEDYESKASITAPAYMTLRPKGAMSRRGGSLVRSIYAVLCAAGGLFILYLFQESIA
jgi:hypothetical protein